ARLRAIRSLGFHVVMDDFGAGHSNLASLPDLPLKGVKIDRSYLASLPGSAPMIEMIIKLADELGVVAMAEGIETDDHVRWLKARSCEQGQGFLLSPPVPLEELPDVVRELRARKAS
ncbi:MAG: EAL domain-containing protein, partial [Pseudomonadota bacterium]